MFAINKTFPFLTHLVGTVLRMWEDTIFLPWIQAGKCNCLQVDWVGNAMQRPRYSIYNPFRLSLKTLKSKNKLRKVGYFRVVCLWLFLVYVINPFT